MRPDLAPRILIHVNKRRGLAVKILITYDIAGMETAEGQARWRKVTNACKAYGQRVQRSVFECLLTPVQLEKVKHLLLDCIDQQRDSLRIYRLPSSGHNVLWISGRKPDFDVEGPLVL